MNLIYTCFEFIIHLNIHIHSLVNYLGYGTYGLIFLIIFCETGLVIFPFLPGDSLLFACGAVAAFTLLSPFWLIITIMLAAFCGDNTNYWIGRKCGAKVFKPNAKIFKTHYLEQTKNFYQKYGTQAIILARYIPIIRTFVPFVAGIGHMKYQKYISISILAALIWSSLLILLGYFFGNIPWVKTHFGIVILIIIIASISPAIIKFIQTRFRV